MTAEEHNLSVEDRIEALRWRLRRDTACDAREWPQEAMDPVPLAAHPEPPRDA